MKTREEKLQEIFPYVEDILEYDKYMKIREINHHFESTIFDHSVDVAYASYKITRKLGLDYKSTVRGGLLHDFFLYNWREVVPKEGLHGFVHPMIAYRNASEKFELNKIEKDIILKHMFPLTIKPPLFLESVIVSAMDKICATSEVFRYIFKMVNTLLIKRKVGYPFITIVIYMTMLMSVKLLII